MIQDFFEAAQKSLSGLNQTDRMLFDYVIKNMDKVKQMSIQKFAAECFLSTTTILRFVRKLGFSGYSDFVNCLLITDYKNQSAEIPAVLHKKVYSQEYLKNVMEAVRVMPEDRLARVREVLSLKPNVYLLCDEHTNDIGRYCERLFMGMGLRTYFPEVGYQLNAVLESIGDEDLLIALSFSGQDPQLLDAVERIFFRKRPFLLSVTRADNNAIQNMSDVNFYIFADQIAQHGIDLTTRVPMIMLMELLVYSCL